MIVAIGLAFAAFAQPVAPDRPKAAGPLDSPATWFTDSDYPPDARPGPVDTRVKVLLVIDTTGKVSGCKITLSSGDPVLDATTCRLAALRGRFDVQKNEAGDSIPYTWPLAIRWYKQK